MLHSLRSGWETISSIGAREREAPGEGRRSRLTNQSAMIGSVTCGSFAVAFAIAGEPFRAPMIANLVTVVMMCGALVLNGRGSRTLARVWVLLPVNLVVVVASLVLGSRVGFLYYFFLFAAVAFLLFAEDERALRWGFAGLSAACCVFVRLAAPEGTAIPSITPIVARVIDVASALTVMGTVIFVVYLFGSDTARAEARLAQEHARSERLLLNILPAEISARLKDDDAAIADRFDDVSVLFADIVGFTEMSQRLSADALVKMLNRIFSSFDDLAETYGIEKIKTIGDCYMVASGLPRPRSDHVEAVAKMAIGMREALTRINEEGGYALHIRIGIHTGPVVAGVIGKRKFIYDLWGDTVNTASRMESSGLVDQIQVTREVHDRLRDTFEMEARGTVTVKGKGEMETFLLLGKKS